jgi:predicted peptidase
MAESIPAAVGIGHPHAECWTSLVWAYKERTAWTPRRGAPQAYPSTPGLYNLTTQAEEHTVSYTLRIPAAYDGHTALPAILCLHFEGQPTEFYGGRFLTLIPIPGLGSLAALLVAPTTEQSGWATPTGETAAFAALAAVEQHLRVDTRRRVVLGYSMGGRGTWHLAATFRPHFVAAIAMAGTPGEIALDTLRDLPLYGMHSEADRRVPIEDAAQAVEHLRAMGAPVEFARLPSGDHFEYRLVITELRNVCPWLETVWQHS